MSQKLREKQATIVGAGVIGVSTAYMLARAGYRVKVLEALQSAGQGTSAENGAQLSYGFADPISSPAVLRRIPGILLGRDPGISIHSRHLLLRPWWTTRFLRNCLATRCQENSAALTALALRSREVVHAIIEATRIDFDFAGAGRLVLFASPPALAAAGRAAARRNSLGCRLRVLDREQCLALEPSLASWQEPIAGGVYSPDDEVGDAGMFCTRLAEYCQRELGVEFIYGFRVQAFSLSGERVVSASDGSDSLAVTNLVACTGADSQFLTPVLRRRLPIVPLKGYSLTFATRPDSPACSIVSAEHRIVFARVGDRMRIAGLAHIRGNNRELGEAFADEMMSLASELYPGACDYSASLSRWCGLRPLTPDGLPVLGRSRYHNLYLNAGHGGLGWTLAAGSAEFLVQMMAAGTPGRFGREFGRNAVATRSRSTGMAA